MTLALRLEENDKVETSEPNPIRLTITRSNLGKGYVFWFLCNLCSRRVKYLYVPRFTEEWACRKCHRLSYRSQRINDSKYFKNYFGRRI